MGEERAGKWREMGKMMGNGMEEVERGRKWEEMRGKGWEVGRKGRKWREMEEKWDILMGKWREMARGSGGKWRQMRAGNAECGKGRGREQEVGAGPEVVGSDRKWGRDRKLWLQTGS